MMGLMTLKEKAEIIKASLAAGKSGNEEEDHLLIMLPLAPHLAMAAKERYGKEYILEQGYNLSKADKVFGDGWLEK